MQYAIREHVVKRHHASFPVRRFRFDFTVSKRYWFGNDPLLTHLFNGMSAIFPRGELYLIKTLRQLRAQIDDPVLQDEISGFIGQEAMHAKEHLAFNRYADEQQIDLHSLERYMDVLYHLFQRYLPPMHNMAIGCAIEHITATLGAELLRRDDFTAHMTGPVGQLWLWHAIEENEHKAVFFDAYRALGGTEWVRRGWMAIASSAVFGFIAYNMCRLVSADRQWSWPHIQRFYQTLIGQHGLINQRVVAEFFDYFSAHFHPNQHDSVAIQQIWRERLALNA